MQTMHNWTEKHAMSNENMNEDKWKDTTNNRKKCINMAEISVLLLYMYVNVYFCYCFAKYPTCTYIQSNAYFKHFAIEWKYEIAHSVRIDNWNRVIYNQTLFAFAYLYFSASERPTERKKPHSMHHQQSFVWSFKRARSWMRMRKALLKSTDR